jgi:dihydroneopterin aldolase
MDQILVRGLRVQTSVGVGDEERARRQFVTIDIDIEIDLSAAGRSDDLDDTISYSQVVAEVTDLVASSNVRLLEHLAERIADDLSSRHHFAGITVEIGKEPPPVAQDVQDIRVRIRRPGRGTG